MPLLGHPVQRLRARPVAAQPDLQEPVAAQRAGLDQPAHRLAVAVERAELDVAGVGVRVEVDHRDPAVAEVPGDAGRVRQRDRVVAAEHQRDRARGWPRRTPPPRGLPQRPLDVAGRHLDVAGVDDPEVLQAVDPQRQVRPGAVVRRGSRSAGSPAARTGCPGGATCRRRTAPRRSPRRPPPSAPASSRSHRVHAEEGDVGAELRRRTASWVDSYQSAAPDRPRSARRNPYSIGQITTDSLAFRRRGTGTMGRMEPLDHVTAPEGRQGPPLDALHPALDVRRRRTCRSSCAARAPTSTTTTASGTSTASPACSSSQLGHGRTELAEAAAKQAARAGVHAAVVLRPPDRRSSWPSGSPATPPVTSTGSSSPPAAARPSRPPGSSPSSTSSSPASRRSTR